MEVRVVCVVDLWLVVVVFVDVVVCVGVFVLPFFLEALGDCRFGDCTHRTEPGCAVRALVDAGGVVAERYASYLAIRAELEAIPEDWE